MKKRLMYCLLVLSFCVFMLPNAVQAKKHKDDWVRSKGSYRYYDQKGKIAKGLKKIGEKYYFFDGSGRQRFGWQKIGSNYYFFNRKKAKNGYMFTSQVVNHITLAKDGKAVNVSANAYRLYALTEAQKLVEAASKPASKKEVKLKKSWDYFQKNYRYRGELAFRGGSAWDVAYARSVFLTKSGNCYALGATWAYIASACGFEESYAVSSGGHGWAEINGKVFDPSWAKTDRRYSYYNMDMSMSGKNRIPNYKKAGIYKKKV